MALIRFDPFRELEEMSARLGPVLGRKAQAGNVDSFGDWAPPMDVQEQEGEYLIKTDLPEVPKDQIKIGVENGVLTIEGERKHEKDEKTKHYHRLEREYGKFVRRLTLPSEVDESKITAEVKDGVLAVHLPKSAATRPKNVSIRVG